MSDSCQCCPALAFTRRDDTLSVIAKTSSFTPQGARGRVFSAWSCVLCERTTAMLLHGAISKTAIVSDADQGKKSRDSASQNQLKSA